MTNLWHNYGQIRHSLTRELSCSSLLIRRSSMGKGCTLCPTWRQVVGDYWHNWHSLRQGQTLSHTQQVVTMYVLTVCHTCDTWSGLLAIWNDKLTNKYTFYYGPLISSITFWKASWKLRTLRSLYSRPFLLSCAFEPLAGVLSRLAQGTSVVYNNSIKKMCLFRTCKRFSKASSVVSVKCYCDDNPDLWHSRCLDLPRNVTAANIYLAVWRNMVLTFVIPTWDIP